MWVQVPPGVLASTGPRTRVRGGWLSWLLGPPGVLASRGPRAGVRGEGAEGLVAGKLRALASTGPRTRARGEDAGQRREGTVQGASTGPRTRVRGEASAACN